MTRLLRLALAAILAATIVAGIPAPAAAKTACCGESCPVSKKTPVKAAKCCQLAPAEKKDATGPVRLSVVMLHETAALLAHVPRPVSGVAVPAVPPACVFDEAPSGLSPPAVLS